MPNCDVHLTTKIKFERALFEVSVRSLSEIGCNRNSLFDSRAYTYIYHLRAPCL